MKLFATIVVIAGLCSANALAQTDPNDPSLDVSVPASDPIDSLSIDQCRTNLRQCLDDLSTQAENYTALLLELARRMGYSSVDEMLTVDCRSRRGTWSNGQCLCSSPNSWYTAETQQCCVSSPTRYERQMNNCEGSGGRWRTCPGSCVCPLGAQLLDGRCQGEAATRDEIERLRTRVPELEAELARLQDELERANAYGEDQAERIAELEQQLSETRGQLAAAQNELNFLRGVLASRNIEIPDQTDDDPLSVPPGVVAAAVEGPAPNPVTDTIPPGEDETNETWCEANPGWCTLVILGSTMAATGLGFGICAAAGCFEPDGIEASWGYNR